MNIIFMGSRIVGPYAAWDIVEVRAAEFGQEPSYLRALAKAASLDREQPRERGATARSES
jgi:hypothetical protein